jgi:hypothetical protein
LAIASMTFFLFSKVTVCRTGVRLLANIQNDN